MGYNVKPETPSKKAHHEPHTTIPASTDWYNASSLSSVYSYRYSTSLRFLIRFLSSLTIMITYTIVDLHNVFQPLLLKYLCYFGLLLCFPFIFSFLLVVHPHHPPMLLSCPFHFTTLYSCHPCFHIVLLMLSCHLLSVFANLYNACFQCSLILLSISL